MNYSADIIHGVLCCEILTDYLLQSLSLILQIVILSVTECKVERQQMITGFIIC